MASKLNSPSDFAAGKKKGTSFHILIASFFKRGIQSVAYAEFVKIFSFILIFFLTLCSRLNMFEVVCVQNFLNNCLPYQFATKINDRLREIFEFIINKELSENESNMGFSFVFISNLSKNSK